MSWPIHYRWSEDQRLDHLRRIRVRRIPALTYPHNPEMAAWLNQWNTEMAAKHDDVLHCGTFYSDPDAPDYVRRALDSGAQLFTAHIQIGEFDPNLQLLTPVWDQLEEAQVPVVIHAGSAPRRGTYTQYRLNRITLM